MLLLVLDSFRRLFHRAELHVIFSIEVAKRSNIAKRATMSGSSLQHISQPHIFNGNYLHPHSNDTINNGRSKLFYQRFKERLREQGQLLENERSSQLACAPLLRDCLILRTIYGQLLKIPRIGRTETLRKGKMEIISERGFSELNYFTQAQLWLLM